MRASVLFEQGKPLSVESRAIKIDQTVPLDRAALIGRSVMTGVGAVINTAAVPPRARISPGWPPRNEAFRALAAGELARGVIVF